MVGAGEWDGKPERYVSRSNLDAPSENSSDKPNQIFVIRGYSLEKKKREIKDGFVKGVVGLIDGLREFRKKSHGEDSRQNVDGSANGDLGVDEFIRRLVGLINGLSVNINKEKVDEFAKGVPGLINGLLRVELDDGGDQGGVDGFVKVVLGLVDGLLKYRLNDDRSVLENPNHPHNVVYLDGACQGPYEDARRRIFSLDHHDGCIRPITLSACEQALYFARKRTLPAVNLTVIGNDPDIDTFLAIYAIIHADRVALDNIFFERLRPIVSLAANIDIYGFGFEDLLNLSENQIRSTRRSISKLISEERDLKSKGKWEATDFVEYTNRMMRRMDKFLFYDEGVDSPVIFDALDRIDLDKDRELVVAISSSSGIYEVEQEILNKHQRRTKHCSCILYHDGKLKFTIKLTGMTSEFSLRPVFDKLSELELKANMASKVTDKRILECDWNGADNIGGPPRYPNGAGSYLDINTIKNAIAEELRRQVEKEKEDHSLQAKSKNDNGNGPAPKPPVDPKVQ